MQYEQSSKGNNKADSSNSEWDILIPRGSDREESQAAPQQEETFKFTKQLTSDPKFQEEHRKYQVARQAALERVSKIDDPSTAVERIRDSIKHKVDSGEITADNLDAAVSSMDVLIDAFGATGKMNADEAKKARELWQQELSSVAPAKSQESSIHESLQEDSAKSPHQPNEEPPATDKIETPTHDQVETPAFHLHAEESHASPEAFEAPEDTISSKIQAMHAAKEAMNKARDAMNRRTAGTIELGMAGEKYDRQKALYEWLRDDCGRAITAAYATNHAEELRAPALAYATYRRSVAAASRAKDNFMNFEGKREDRIKLKDISDGKAAESQGALGDYERSLAALEDSDIADVRSRESIEDFRLSHEPAPDDPDTLRQRIAEINDRIAKLKSSAA